MLSAIITLVIAQAQLPIPAVGAPLLSLSVKERNQVAGSFTLGVLALRFDSRNVPGATASLTITRAVGPALQPIFHLETDQKSSATVEVWGGALRVTRRPEGISQRGNAADVERLLRAPELATLVPLSFALAGVGVNGKQYPGALPLYMTALRVARFYDAHPAYRSVKALAPPAITQQAPAPACQSLLTCTSSDCLGMCGAGCNCWMFVCQDCCCNKGCLNHDVASGNCDPKSPVGLFDCLRYVSGDAGAPLFECGGCDGCQH